MRFHPVNNFVFRRESGTPSSMARTAGSAFGFRVVSTKPGAYPIWVDILDSNNSSVTLPVVDASWVPIPNSGVSLVTKLETIPDDDYGYAETIVSGDAIILLADSASEMTAPDSSARHLEKSGVIVFTRQTTDPSTYVSQTVVLDAVGFRTCSIFLDPQPAGTTALPGDPLNLRVQLGFDGVEWYDWATVADAATVPTTKTVHVVSGFVAPYLRTIHDRDDGDVSLAFFFQG